MSQVVIAGGSGYLGRALAARLAREGHQVVVLTRAHANSKYEVRTSKAEADKPSRIRYAEWTPDGTAGAWAEEIAAADAVVNLAGAGIADRRWTESRKRLLVESRILSTRSLVAAIREAEKRPSLFVQASGIGYYGSFEDGPALDESSRPGDDFLAKLCVTWEGEAQPVQAFDCRLVIIRSGIVLSLTNPQNVAYWAAVGSALRGIGITEPTIGDNLVFFTVFMTSSTIWAVTVSSLIDRVFRRAGDGWTRLTYRACAIALLALALALLRELANSIHLGTWHQAPGT